MKEDVIIIHGYKADGNCLWLPWLAQKLEAHGHRVWHPSLPHPDHPKLEEWMEAFQKAVQETDRPLILIGHSLGGSLMLKLLEKEYEWTSRLVRVYALGAPTYLRTKAPDFFEPPLNWSQINKRSDKLVAVWSTDDDRVPESHVRQIEKETSARIVILEGLGHFKTPTFEWLLQDLVLI